MNTEFIKNNIQKYSDNEKVQKILVLIIGKILLKQENIENYIKENENKIMHIIDWISSVVENNEKWKNQRVLTLEALNNAADKYFEKKNNKIKTIELDENHEKLIADLGDYYIVQMLTPQALDNESKQMQHCIGHGGYDEKLKNSDYEYLSLRDRYNKAHVTVEIKNKNVKQLYGKQNKIPEFKYIDIFVKYLNEKKYNLDLKNYNLVKNKVDNKIYSIYNLPDNCEIIGDINLINTKKYNIQENIIINGDFTFDLNLKEIHKNVKVNGYMCFEATYFKQNIIPDNLYVDNRLNTYDLINFLLEKGYFINIEKYNLIFNLKDKLIYSIYDMPDNCEVKNLNLRNNKISKLPNNLTVNYNLEIRNNQNFKKMPNKLTVNGDLILENIDIKNLPKDLVISGCLVILNCKNIKKISNNIKIGKSFDICNIEIDELSKNLKCHNLQIRKDQIKLVDERMEINFISVKESSTHRITYTKKEFFKIFNDSNILYNA